MDKKDNVILGVLKANSRQSVRDIAKRTKLRPSTVHNRIKKLTDEGIIRNFTIRVDNEKTGKNFVVYVLVKTIRNIPNSFFNQEDIEETYGITGGYDLILKCRFNGIEDFNKFILKLREIDGVTETLTMIGTVKLKET